MSYKTHKSNTKHDMEMIQDSIQTKIITPFCLHFFPIKSLIQLYWTTRIETFVPFIRKFTKKIEGHIELQFKINFSKQKPRES